MIKPTIGRKVWFYPNQQEDKGFRLEEHQPCDATIVYVHDERTVNAVVLSHEGIAVIMFKLKLLQDDDPIPPRTERYLTWMPYQIGQAAKHEKDPDGLGE
jgi:hypothetical protein